MDHLRTLKKDTTPIQGGVDSMVAALVSELMNAGTSLHKLHLKITGTGSFAAHKALNKLYDAMPEHADSIAESYQGASEKLLSYKDIAPKQLNSVEEAIEYLRELTKMVNGLQAKMPYSEIINELDNVKSTIDSGKYKLLFLK